MAESIESGADLGGELDAAAASLCAALPTEFIATRAALAASATPQLAARIRKLPKPVLAAWAMNRLARSGGLSNALALAAALREATEQMDANELTRLGAERRALVAALSSHVAAAAASAGVSVGPGAQREIEQTIDAAVRDPLAAAAVLSGRLIKPLQANGIEGLDPRTLADVVAGSAPILLADAPPPAPTDELAERRARKDAERALRETEKTAANAERTLARAQARAAAVRERHARLTERARELRRELARIEEQCAGAGAELAEQEEAAAAAQDALATANSDREQARRALD